VILCILLLLGNNGSSGEQLTLESDGSGFFELPDSLWVEPGSAFAVSGHDTLSAVTGASGSRIGLIVSPSPADGDSVVLHFQRLPLTVPSSAGLELEPLERIPITLPSRYTSMASDQGLYVSGAKRLGLSVGDGAGMTQGTRISIEGMLTHDIHVSGSVTDENLPIGSGSSELLSELDRVLLQVEGTRWAARLGDMDWERQRTEWSALVWEREVSGIEVSGEPVGGFGALAGYGSAATSRARVVFYTEEGIQGPYEVCKGAEIVAGSERVWLDGTSMTRGRTADYEIDYTSGLVTFTAGRLIRRDQRVEITYSKRGDGFRKELFSGDASWTTQIDGDDSLSVLFSSILQADSRNDPLGFVLSEEAIDVLSAAGENPLDAWISGATYVGDSNGSYSQDSLGHFVYEGLNTGDWQVIFQRPPEGSGDYIYDSAAGGYLWAGEGEGSHLPRQYLEIPSSHDLGGVRISSSFGIFSSTFEGTFSERTGNLYNQDSTTRQGSFLSGRLIASPWEENGFFLGMSGRLVSSGFRPAGDIEADSSLASWFLPLHHDSLDDILLLSSGKPGLLTLSGGLRYMEEGGRLERYRAAVTPRWSIISASAGYRYVRRLEVETISTGNASDLYGNISLDLDRFTPTSGISILRENWSDSLSGTRSSIHAGTLFEAGVTSLFGLVELERDNRTGIVSAPDRVWRYTIEGRSRPSRFSVSGSFEHSTSTWKEGGSSDADAIELMMTGTMGSTWVNMIYSGSGIISRSLEVLYYYVGEGQGSYSYDPETGQYYPDQGGDYEIQYQPGGAGDTVVEADLSMRFSSTASRSGMDGILELSSKNSGTRLETLLLAGAFRPGDPGGYTAELSPWLRWDDGLLRRLSIRGKLRDETIDYSGTGNRREREWVLEATTELRPVSSVRLRSTGRMWMTREELYQLRETRGLRGELDPVLSVAAGVEPGLAISIENRRESEQELDETMYGLRPHISVSSRGWIASGQLSIGYIPGEGVLPSWFFDGSDRGTSLAARMRIGRSLSQWLQVSLFYWGRRPAGSEWTQQGGLEGTVTF
jgi:hypothetical protein